MLAHTHTHTDKHTKRHIWIHKHRQIHALTQTHRQIHTYTDIYTDTHTHTHNYTQVHTRTHKYTHTSTHTYTQVHTHKYTHTNKHLYAPGKSCAPRCVLSHPCLQTCCPPHSSRTAPHTHLPNPGAAAHNAVCFERDSIIFKMACCRSSRCRSSLPLIFKMVSVYAAKTDTLVVCEKRTNSWCV
jgi:hypothetical protein